MIVDNVAAASDPSTRECQFHSNQRRRTWTASRTPKTPRPSTWHQLKSRWPSQRQTRECCSKSRRPSVKWWCKCQRWCRTVHYTNTITNRWFTSTRSTTSIIEYIQRKLDVRRMFEHSRPGFLVTFKLGFRVSSKLKFDSLWSFSTSKQFFICLFCPKEKKKLFCFLENLFVNTFFSSSSFECLLKQEKNI